MRAEVRGAGGPRGVGGEERVEVAALEGEEGEPGGAGGLVLCSSPTHFPNLLGSCRGIPRRPFDSSSNKTMRLRSSRLFFPLSRSHAAPRIPWRHSPVQVRNQRIQRERRLVMLILPPNRAVAVTAGRGEVEIDADDEQEEPGDEGEDLVGGEGLGAVGFMLGEGVDWREGMVSVIWGMDRGF